MVRTAAKTAHFAQRLGLATNISLRLSRRGRPCRHNRPLPSKSPPLHSPVSRPLLISSWRRCFPDSVPGASIGSGTRTRILLNAVVEHPGRIVSSLSLEDGEVEAAFKWALPINHSIILIFTSSHLLILACRRLPSRGFSINFSLAAAQEAGALIILNHFVVG